MELPFGSFGAFPPPGLLSVPFNITEDTSPLLRNQHLWPDAYKTDNFRMFHLKVIKCHLRESHNWKQCPFQHVSENARRRDPRKWDYTTEACPMYHHGICLFGKDCPFSHGVHEQLLHPAKFRTALCKRAGGCNREVCFFAHSPSELRLPACEPSESTRLRASHLLYAWELWHRQGEYPPGCTAFAFAAAAAAAGFRSQRPDASPSGKPGPGGHTTARMRAGIAYTPVEQMYLNEITAALPLFCQAFQVECGDLSIKTPVPRMANDLAIALGLKHVDMGQSGRLRRSPPGSCPASPLFGGARSIFGFGASPAAALAEHQQQHLQQSHQQQALLRAATLSAIPQLPRSGSSSSTASRAASGPLPDPVPVNGGSLQHKAAQQQLKAATVAAATRSDAESAQACSPFAADALCSSGSSHGGNRGKLRAKSTIAGGCWAFDIHAAAGPLTIAPPAPLADLSKFTFGGSLLGPFASDALQQLQQIDAAGSGWPPMVSPFAAGLHLDPRLNPAAPAFDPSGLAATGLAAVPGGCHEVLAAASNDMGVPQAPPASRRLSSITSETGLKRAVSPALAMFAGQIGGFGATASSAIAPDTCYSDSAAAAWIAQEAELAAQLSSIAISRI